MIKIGADKIQKILVVEEKRHQINTNIMSLPQACFEAPLQLPVMSLATAPQQDHDQMLLLWLSFSAVSSTLVPSRSLSEEPCIANIFRVAAL